MSFPNKQQHNQLVEEELQQYEKRAWQLKNPNDRWRVLMLIQKVRGLLKTTELTQP